MTAFVQNKPLTKNLLKMSLLSAMVAALSGCGEDAKDCGGFFDKTFGREACLKTNVITTSANQTTKNTAVSVQLSSTAIQGKKVEVMSMVDVVSGNAVNQPIPLDTRERDTVMALVDDNIALFALKYDEKPVSLTPASTATYLVLQIKGMLDLPEQQLKQAITDIESDATYPKLVSYINFKVQSGFSDPLNVEADPALMKLVVEISNKLDVTKYQTTSNALSDSSVIQKSYAALPTSQSFSLGDVLLSLVGIQTANADESTIMGDNELVLGQPESNNVKFTNYTFNPFFAYINNDGSQSGKWNYISGKDSIVEFDFKLADIEKAANIQADDGRFMRMLKRMAAIPSASIKDGKQETTLTLNGVNGSGKNTLYVESQGLCQAVLDDSSIDEMTSQQLVASAINGFSLFMAVADVALKANELAAAQDALVKELTSPVNIAKSVAEYKKIKEAVGKAKLEFDQALEKLEKIKVFNDFLKAFVEHVKEIKEKNKLPIENELILLEGALEATDKIINANISYVKAFNTTPQKHKSLVKELLSALGDTVGEGIIETDAKLLAEAIYNKDYKIEHSTKFYEGMSQYAVKVLQTSDVIAALNPVKGDDVDALKVIDAITHNEFFQEIFSTVIQKAASSAAKAMFKGGFRKKAAQFNVASKAASLTWGIGTKLLPMMWDSCTTSKKLSIGIVNGKISQYQAPKVDLWIEDLTTGKPVYWYNNMGESLSASGDTLTAIQGRKYRIHLKSKQAGILDYSLDNNKSDAVHKSWIRTPVKVNGLFIRRTTVENENQILAHKQLCARRALQDGNTMVYGLNQFTTLSGFACVEGQVGTGDAQLFSPPFNQTQGFVQHNGNVNYATTTYREGLGFSSWQELTSGATKNLGFGGEVSDTFDFTEDKLTKSLFIEIEGFNDEIQQGEDAKQIFDIRVVNNADAVISSNAKPSAANGPLYVGDAITAKVTQIVGKVVSVFWQLINSLGEVVKSMSAVVAESASFATDNLSGGTYEIKAELRDENAQPIGVVSQSIPLLQTDFKSVNVQSMPVGVPVAITVYGKDLPSTTVFAVEGVLCEQPLIDGVSVTQICTASEVKNNVKLTVKRKTQVDEGSRIFSINITPKSVAGQFVVPATSTGVEFIPPIDNTQRVSELGLVVGYGASRRNMTCSFTSTGNTKTYKDYPDVDANGYSTDILPLLNGFANMALLATKQQGSNTQTLLIGNSQTVSIAAGQTLNFYVNDDNYGDNEGALTVNYQCTQLTATIQPSTTTPVAQSPITIGFVDTVIANVKDVVWAVSDAVSEIFVSVRNGLSELFDYSFSKSGDYKVTATVRDANNQTIATSSTQLTVTAAPPTASLLGSATTGIVGQPVVFVLNNSKALEGKICSYLFAGGGQIGDSGGGDCSNASQVLVLPSITELYTTAGTYTATLTVTDSQGKTATTSHIITVTEATQTASTGLLNDTGITQCSDQSTLFADCTAASMGGWFGLNQDGETGRDLLAVKGTLAKTGAGDAGFDFTKISATGLPLPASATEWSCVQDNHTGLMWEVKTDDGGLRDKDNYYTWYNTNAATNGSYAGTENGGKNTQAFVQAVNAQDNGQGLCGHSNWRLPTKQELHSIVNYGKYNPAIDTAYFPNTVNSWYWSSSPVAYYSYVAWFVTFDYGSDYGGDKNSNNYVRLVRSSQ